MSEESTRLNKHLALQLGVSRREADEMIAVGKVQIDGDVAALGSRIKPGQNVTVDGTPVAADTSYKYIALNKPVGYVCTRKAQDENPTVYSLLPEEYRDLKLVGRLDKDSSGIILLTNDGDFAQEMTHPKYHKIKRYEVTLESDLAPLHQQMISDYGVELADGFSKLTLEGRNEKSRADWYVTMSEGRNRQIRRTFGALGYTVITLRRIQFGMYELALLGEGKFETIERHD